jgi:hypothetical protein
MPTVDLDRLKIIISSGSVVMKTDANACFQDGDLVYNVFEVRSGQN